MELQVVAIYDAKAQAYGTPNFVVSLGVAIRGFTDEVNRPDPKSVLYMHPDDFVLHHLGTFHDDTAVFTQPGIPREICRGREVAIRNQEA